MSAMCAAQMAKQIRKEVRAAAWPDGTGARVVGGGAFVSMGPEEQHIPASFPFALIGIGPYTADPHAHELIEQDFLLTIVARNEGDPLGESALVGGVRSGLGLSAGRGLLEIEAPILNAVKHLTGADGAPIDVSLSSAPQVTDLGDRTIVHRSHLLKARCLLTPGYESPWNLVVAQGAAGHATVTWRAPSSRFDFRRCRLVRKAGSSAPTSVSDGTVVYSGSAETYDDACGAGTWSWTIFATYFFPGEGGSEANAADDNVSAVVTGTTRTKAIT